MNPKCIAAVNAVSQAAGRGPLTDSQIRAIESRMDATARYLARRDGAKWQSMTREARMVETAKLAQSDIRAEANRKLANAERQILRIAQTEQRVKALQNSFDGTKGHSGTRAEALRRDFELTHITMAPIAYARLDGTWRVSASLAL